MPFVKDQSSFDEIRYLAPYIKIKDALYGLRLFSNWKPFKNDGKCFFSP